MYFKLQTKQSYFCERNDTNNFIKYHLV